MSCKNRHHHPPGEFDDFSHHPSIAVHKYRTEKPADDKRDSADFAFHSGTIVRSRAQINNGFNNG
jgi:hypothetical protein